jgi:hypothetical protein
MNLNILSIAWMDPHWWVWLLASMGVVGLIAAYNIYLVVAAREIWGDRISVNDFSPVSISRTVSLWAQWAACVGALVVALCGPNVSTSPKTVEAGAVEWVNVFDVSPSEAAEDTRPYYAALTGLKDPGAAFQWGTRLDTNKAFFKRDLLPQLENNKAGIITVEGAGYNMWDITSDLAVGGAFQQMLNQFVQIGAAPGGGCDYTSGLQSALDEFELIASMEQKAANAGGNKVDKDARQNKAGYGDNKVRFIALWTDGGFTGDEKELFKVLDLMVERKVRLLIVNTAGNAEVTVPKYDLRTHRRNGESYKGTTKADNKLLQRMADHMKGLGTLIVAPPGTEHISYSIPQQAGGRYSRPTEGNLKPYLLALAGLLFLSITAGGGGLPRLRFFLPKLSLSGYSLASLSTKLGIWFAQPK